MHARPRVTTYLRFERSQSRCIHVCPSSRIYTVRAGAFKNCIKEWDQSFYIQLHLFSYTEFLCLASKQLQKQQTFQFKAIIRIFFNIWIIVKKIRLFSIDSILHIYK